MARRAANCVKLKRCSPKVASAERASLRTRSSTASRHEPTRSSSVAAAKDRMNSAAAAIRSAADGDCRTRSMPAGNVTLWGAASQTAPCYGSEMLTDRHDALIALGEAHGLKYGVEYLSLRVFPVRV